MNNDQAIIHVMHDQENAGHYQRYLQGRFIVQKIHETPMGMCAHVMDTETGAVRTLHTGDQIAVGSVGQVTADGVIYHPPRADVPKFVLPSAKEFSPIGSEGPSKFRHEMNDILSREEPKQTGDDAIIIAMLEKAV